MPIHQGGGCASSSTFAIHRLSVCSHLQEKASQNCVTSFQDPEVGSPAWHVEAKRTILCLTAGVTSHVQALEWKEIRKPVFFPGSSFFQRWKRIILCAEGNLLVVHICLGSYHLCTWYLIDGCYFLLQKSLGWCPGFNPQDKKKKTKTENHL